MKSKFRDLLLTITILTTGKLFPALIMVKNRAREPKQIEATFGITTREFIDLVAAAFQIPAEQIDIVSRGKLLRYDETLAPVWMFEDAHVFMIPKGRRVA